MEASLLGIKDSHAFVTFSLGSPANVGLNWKTVLSKDTMGETGQQGTWPVCGDVGVFSHDGTNVRNFVVVCCA